MWRAWRSPRCRDRRPLKGSPPAFIDDAHNEKLWHISFNRVNDDLILDMVSSNADAYYRYEYDIQGGGTTPPEKAIKYYIGLYTENRAALRASFGFYRAWDTTTAQNGTRAGDTAVDPCAGNRRREQLGSRRRGRHARVRDQRADRGHPRRRALGRRAGTHDLLSALVPFLEPYRTGS